MTTFLSNLGSQDDHNSALISVANTILPGNGEYHMETVLGDVELHPAGSTYIVGKGNDLDVLVYPAGNADLYETRLVEAGYVLCSSDEYPDDKFSAWRKGDINVIMVYDKAYYDSWRRASTLCRLINKGLLDLDMSNKEARVTMHRFVMDA